MKNNRKKYFSGICRLLTKWNFTLRKLSKIFLYNDVQSKAMIHRNYQALAENWRETKLKRSEQKNNLWIMICESGEQWNRNSRSEKVSY